ncbi:KH domain-containing protein [filamentous cyanobacterium CCP5]|nr:KH domain-containing protein [filamentous cyanobacterium CCP5]
MGAGSPDFLGLVRFLIEPFLDDVSSLRADCELAPNRSKVWIRLAFKEEDRGRVFGRGGRNIQAIRKVLNATAKMVGWSAYLDIYGESSSKSSPSRGGRPKPSRPNRRTGEPIRRDDGPQQNS